MPHTSPAALDRAYDVCIVGAGPAGLACALDCHDAGLKTLVLEAGGLNPIPGSPDILAAQISDPAWHDQTSIVAAACVGGTSHRWGGRCVPLDPADFRHWPIDETALTPWWEKAAAFLGAHGISESPPPPGFETLTRFDALRDESWGPERNMARRWRARLRARAGPAIVRHARVTALGFANGRVTRLSVRIGATEKTVRADHIVLACGGLGVLRLLLLAQRAQPRLFGGAEGPLGRGYIGHLAGSISAITLTDPANAQAFACRMLERGVYARRRLRPTEAALREGRFSNIAFWLDNPSDARDNLAAIARSLATRLAALAARNGRLGLHIGKFTRAPLSAAVGLSGAVFQLVYAKLSGGHPGAVDLIPDASGAWRLSYHGEQMRNGHNRVRLSDEGDILGLPKLAIDFQMNDADFESVLAAHEALDADLRASGLGALRFDAGRAETLAAIASAARDGYHQLGGAAMSATPGAGVVNTDCRVHDIANLWIASSCVFPSGGQANPTLTIVALARRLAATLARRT